VRTPLDCELTPREHEIITLVSSGLSNKEIARRLHLAKPDCSYRALTRPFLSKCAAAIRVRRSNDYALLRSALVETKKAHAVLMTAWPCHHAAYETRSGDVLILLC
jgi:FixJ family two-component response regulator